MNAKTRTSPAQTAAVPAVSPRVHDKLKIPLVSLMFASSLATAATIDYGFLMGFGNDPTLAGQIWKVDASGDSEFLYDTGFGDDVGGINGLGIDTTNGDLYFSSGVYVLAEDKYVKKTINRLNIFNLGAGVQTLTTLGIGNDINGADFYNGKYYYVVNNSNELRAYDPVANSDALVDTLQSDDGGNAQWKLGDIFFVNQSLVVTGKDWGLQDNPAFWSRYLSDGILDGVVNDLAPDKTSNLTALGISNSGDYGSRYNGGAYDPISSEIYGYSTDDGGDFYSLGAKGKIQSTIVDNSLFFAGNGDATNFTTFIPEPSTSMISLLAAGLLMLRRKRV